MNINSTLLLFSLPLGFLNFSIFNAVFTIFITAILTIKIGLTAKANTLNYLLAFALYTIFFIIAIYHISNNNFRYIWVLRYFMILHILILISISNIRHTSPNKLELILSSFIASLHLLSDIYQIFTNSGLYLNSTYRYYGFTAERIVFSNFITIFIIFVMKFKEFREKFPYQTNLVYILCITHIILSGSRSFLILAILILIFQNRKFKFKSLIYLLPFLGLITSIAFLIFPRFRNLINFETGSGLSRLNFINQGVEMFLNAPIFGVGFGKSIDILTQNLPWEESPAMHQDILQIFAEGGIALGFLYLFFILKFGIKKNFMLLVLIVILSTQNFMYYTLFCIVFFAYLRTYEVRNHVNQK